jgi:hypothetical protein
MQFLFSASSAFDLFKGEADLSRRVVIEELPGMAFREYLQLAHGIHFEPISLESLLNKPADWAKYVNQSIKPLPLFLDYLKRGYFPFSCLENDWGINLAHLTNIVNTILERDLAFIEDYSASNVLKIKRLLGVIAKAAPFEPNISKIAQKLKLGRNTVYNYLKHLTDARLLNFLHKQGKSIAALQKPDKLYFENPNMAMAYGKSADTGALRETFFINQLRNAGYRLALADKGDFIIDDQYTFEIGGPNKTTKQIKGLPESYLAMDNIEYGFGRQIPLWLFGFLY